jgi:polyphosphate glucokinase
MQNILGIDVGASGIKGALVDLETGKLAGERLRVPTPKSGSPEEMADAFAEIAEFFKHQGPIGCGFPAIVKNGICASAANISPDWIGKNIETLLGEATNCPVYATNDADAAGVAEMKYGVGRGEKGLVILITIGTGLGSAMFFNDVLIPNTEFGHLLFPKKEIAELYASSSARENLKLSRKDWSERFNKYLIHLERLFSPDLFILGGGESKSFETYKQAFTTNARVMPAQLLNNAGIIGAAAYAAKF